MPDQFRLSPDGMGIARGNKTVDIDTLDAAGAVVSTRRVSADGAAPQFRDRGGVFFTRHSADGPFLLATEADQWRERPVFARGFNVFSVAGPFWGGYRVDAGQAAITWHDGTRTLNADSPAVNDRGDRAWLDHGTHDLYVSVVEDGQRSTKRVAGPDCLEPRWTGRWLAWSNHGLIFVRDPNGTIGGPYNVRAAEGRPLIVLAPAGSPWLLTNDDTSTLLRPLGEVFGYELARASNQYFPDALFVDAVRVLYAWSPNAGGVVTGIQDIRDQRRDLRLALKPMIYAGFFVTTDRYPNASDWQWPGNAEVCVDSGVARAPGPVIVDEGAIPSVKAPRAVIGLYVGIEDESAAIDAGCRAARAAWRARFPTVDVPPVIAYLTPNVTRLPAWPPREPDVYAPQFYFDGVPSEAELVQMRAFWDARLPADRDWLLTAQAYDRSRLDASGVAQLAMLTPSLVATANTAPHIRGLLCFAVKRPGGIGTYPLLQTAHDAIAAALPASIPTLAKRAPSTPTPPPSAGKDPMKITIRSYTPEVPLGESIRIDFDLTGPVRVTELTVDSLDDGVDGLTITPVGNSDLRDLTSLSVRTKKAGRFRLQLRGNDVNNQKDATNENARPFTVISK